MKLKKENESIKHYKTKYYGIWVQREKYDLGNVKLVCWFLIEEKYGSDEAFDHYPTEEEIDKFRNEVIK